MTSARTSPYELKEYQLDDDWLRLLRVHELARAWGRREVDEVDRIRRTCKMGTVTDFRDSVIVAKNSHLMPRCLPIVSPG